MENYFKKNRFTDDSCRKSRWQYHITLTYLTVYTVMVPVYGRIILFLCNDDPVIVIFVRPIASLYENNVYDLSVIRKKIK